MTAGLLAIALVLACAAGPARAASVEVEPDCDRHYGCTHTARYSADPGERNVLEVTMPERGVLRIRDSGARELRVGTGCAAEDPATIVCRGAPGDNIELAARLEDGDDRAVVAGGSVAAGAGDDVIAATEGARLRGGPGRDVLTGSAATDHFSDGDGRRASADRYVGGAGSDFVAYSGRRTPLRIDLRRGTAGEDALDSIESAAAGSGDDRLVGTAEPNVLHGGPGDDVIDAGAGDDQIRPGKGADVVRTGRGDDGITLPDFTPLGTGDRIACGSGRDLVDSTGESDLLRPGCERFAFNDSLALDNFPHHFPRRAGAMVLEIKLCCRGFSRASAEMTAGGVRVGRTVRRAGTPLRLRLRLSARGWAMLRRAGRLRAQVTFRSGPPMRERRGVRLELRAARRR